mgnify:CR=1 FL=1
MDHLRMMIDEKLLFFGCLNLYQGKDLFHERQLINDRNFMFEYPNLVKCF